MKQMDTHELGLIIKEIFKDVAHPLSRVIGDPDGALSYAYVRVSSSGQAEEGRSGLPRQLTNIHEKAQEMNLKVPLELVYYDDHTGFEFRDRPGLQKLLAEVGRPHKGANYVVIEYIDRLSRQAKWHQGFLLDLFAEHSISVYFWKPFGSEIERAVMGAISEQGMRDEIDRMTEGTRLKARSGRITAKTAAYGYIFADSEGRPYTDPASNYRKDTHYLPNPDEARVVQEVYRRIVSGDTLYTICNNLNERQIPTPKGARYWEMGSLSKLVKNPVYKGEYIANHVYNTKEWSERHQRTVRKQHKRPQEEWIIVPVPPLVSAELWQAAQDALKRNIKISTRNAHASYLLQRFLRCACCGENVGITIIARSGGGKKHLYLCRSRFLQPVLREKLSCGSPSILGEEIDEHVWNSICQVITEPDLIIGYLEAQSESIAKGGLDDQLTYINRQLQKCQREEEQWDRAYAAEIFSLEEYRDKKSSLASRKRALHEEREQLCEELSVAMEFEQQKETVRQQLQALREFGFGADLPFQDKRRILGLIIDHVVIDTKQQWYTLEGAIRGTYHYNGDALTEDTDSSFTLLSAPSHLQSSLERPVRHVHQSAVNSGRGATPVDH
ncbi:MAG: recombinase family protein [Caldilineaceae bacterium]|nr:recombinase family protein [Caldilineaceae bacterium]